MSKHGPLILAVALLAAASGYLVARYFGGSERAMAEPEQPGVASLVGQRRPDFTHTDLDGRPVSAVTFDGQVLLINFWATWCAPCVDEMPMLSAVHENFRPLGFNVVGIALDDPARAGSFARELGVSYPVLVGETDVVMTARRYGNTSGMLPYSVLIDAEGVVRWTQLGALDKVELRSRIDRLTASPGPDK